MPKKPLLTMSLLAAVLVVSTLAFPVFAAGDLPVYTFPQVLDLVWRGNRDLGQAETNLREARVELEETRKARFSLNLSTQPQFYGEEGSDSFWKAETSATLSAQLPSGGTVAYQWIWLPGNEQSIGYLTPGEGWGNPAIGEIQLTQPLFRSPETTGLGYQLKQAELKLYRREQEKRQTEDRVWLETLTAYVAVLKAQDNLEVAQRNLNQAQRQLKARQKQKDEGLVLPINVSEAELAVMQAELAVKKAQHLLEQACVTLNNLTGGQLPASFRLARPALIPSQSGDLLTWEEQGVSAGLSGSELVAKLSLPPLEEWQKGLAQHPGWLAAESDVTLASLGVKAAVEGLRPQVALTGSYGQSYNAMLGIADSGNTWSIGVKVTLDLNLAGFGGLSSQGAARSAEAGLHQAEKARADLQETLKQALLQDYQAWEEAKDRLLLAQRTLEKARKWAQIQQVKAEEGVITTLERDQAQDEVFKAECDYYAAAYDYQLALERLRVDSGQGRSKRL